MTWLRVSTATRFPFTCGVPWKSPKILLNRGWNVHVAEGRVRPTVTKKSRLEETAATPVWCFAAKSYPQTTCVFPTKSQSTACNLHTVGPCLQFSRFTVFLTTRNQSVALPLPALAPHQATDMHQKNKTNREKKKRSKGEFRRWKPALWGNDHQYVSRALHV